MSIRTKYNRELVASICPVLGQHEKKDRVARLYGEIALVLSKRLPPDMVGEIISFFCKETGPVQMRALTRTGNRYDKAKKHIEHIKEHESKVQYFDGIIDRLYKPYIEYDTSNERLVMAEYKMLDARYQYRKYALLERRNEFRSKVITELLAYFVKKERSIKDVNDKRAFVNSNITRKNGLLAEQNTINIDTTATHFLYRSNVMRAQREYRRALIEEKRKDNSESRRLDRRRNRRRNRADKKASLEKANMEDNMAYFASLPRAKSKK